MATWTPSSIKGQNGGVPVGTEKQSVDGIHAAPVSFSGQPGTLERHVNNPGDYSFNEHDDTYFGEYNIVSNGDFQKDTVTDTNGGSLVGWINGGTHNSDNHFTIVDAGGDEGKRLNIIRGAEGGIFWIAQEILTPLGSYTYSIEVDDLGSGLWFFTCGDAGANLTLLQLLTAGSNSGTFTPPNTATFLVLYPAAAVDTTIVDNIVVTPNPSHIPDGTDEAGDSDGIFNTTTKSQWFRDDGNTTT